MKKMLGVGAVLAVGALPMLAQTDMNGVVDSVDTIVTAATGLAIGVLLFVLGRKVLKKLI